MQATLQKIRRLTLAITKSDGAYYYFARSRQVNENMLMLLYALDDGLPHSQKQVCSDWLLPKTTVNSVVRELRAAGHLELISQTNSREKLLALTESGRAFAQALLQPLYRAERAAMERTVARYSADFLDAYDHFADCFAAEIFAQLHPDSERKGNPT